MTKQQEEAIEYVQEQIDYYKEQIKFIEAVDSDYYDEEYEIYKNRVKQFETVLSMLKEKDKEVEELKADNKKAWKLNANMSKRHLTDIFKIKKKDKQIDLMAEEINETDRGYTDYCEMKIECDRNCKDCIKRYYERKATNNG